MNQLVRYDTMCVAIEACFDYDELLYIDNHAAALAAAHKIAQNTEAETKARVIRLRAQRRIGELLASVPNSVIDHRGKRRPVDDRIALIEKVGIKPKRASEYVRLARVPTEKFEKAIKEKQSPTAEEIVREAFPPEPRITEWPQTEKDAAKVILCKIALIEAWLSATHPVRLWFMQTYYKRDCIKIFEAARDDIIEYKSHAERIIKDAERAKAMESA